MPTQVGIHDLPAAPKKVVDADLRQHDDVASTGMSLISSAGMTGKAVSSAFKERMLDNQTIASLPTDPLSSDVRDIDSLAVR